MEIMINGGVSTINTIKKEILSQYKVMHWSDKYYIMSDPDLLQSSTFWVRSGQPTGRSLVGWVGLMASH